MRRIRFGTRSLLILVTACAFLMPLAIAAVRAYRLASGSRIVLTRAASDPAFDSRYRVAILYDCVASSPISVYIEKSSQNIERSDLPFFCTREVWVRTDGRRATCVMDLKVNGELIVPMEGVQVFSADLPQLPQKQVMTKEQYLVLAGSDGLPKSDDELWNALHLEASKH